MWLNKWVHKLCLQCRSRSFFNLKPMSVIVYQFQTVRFIQNMSFTFGLFTQVSSSGPLGPLVWLLNLCDSNQRTSETLLWGRKNLSSVISCGEVTLAGVPAPLHLLVVWKSGYLLSKLFSTDVSIQVNKGMRMIATLAELGCFACELCEGRTTAVAVLTWEWVPLTTRLWGS